MHAQHILLVGKDIIEDGEYLTDEGMKELKNITILQSLNFNWNKNITNLGIQYLPSNIIKLELGGFNNISYEIFDKLPSSIKELGLYRFEIKLDELKYLNSNIQILNIHECELNRESLKYLPSSKK